MKKVFALLTCAAVTSAMAVTASRVGPVSTYGELVANGGKLSGSCPEYSQKVLVLARNTLKRLFRSRV